MHYFHTLYKRTNTVAHYKKNIDFSQYNPRQQEIMKETLATLQLLEERQQAQKEKRQEAKRQAQINQDIDTKIKSS